MTIPVRLALLVTAALATMASTVRGGPVRFVDADAPPGGDGLLWATAYDDLQDALLEALADGGVQSIRVAEGTYRPDRGTGDPFLSFEIASPLIVLGGYAGFDTENPNLRDPAAHPTILTGDLEGNDGPNIDVDDPTRQDNALHVLVVANFAEVATLDGLIVEGGNAAFGLDGGGLLSTSATIEVRNCTFRRNAAERGGAVYVDGTDARFSKCSFDLNAARASGGAIHNDFVCFFSPCGLDVEFSTFTNNTALGTADAQGGAVYGGGCATLSGCRFTGNEATHGGGAVSLGECDDAPPRVSDCVFSGNTAAFAGALVEEDASIIERCEFISNVATEGGGAMLTHNCSLAVVTNCLFVGNAAGFAGGAIGAMNLPGGINCMPTPGIGPRVTQCTIVGNTVTRGSGGGIWVANGDLELDTSILWDNEPDQIATLPSRDPRVSYTDLQGGVPTGVIDGGHNLDADPQFVSALGRDHLLSQMPRQGADSPCLDAGPARAGEAFANTTTRTDQASDEGLIDLGFHYTVDCNENGVPDALEIACQPSIDCDGNGRPDECDIASGRAEDCNGNGTPDACELADLLFGGPVIIGGDDADDHGFHDDVAGNQEGWLFVEEAFNLIGPEVGNLNTLAVCLGCTGGQAQGGFASGFDDSALPGGGWDRVSISGPEAIAAFFDDTGAVRVADAGIIYMPTDVTNITGGLSPVDAVAIASHASQLNQFVLSGGGLFVHDQRGVAGGFAWLSALLPDIVLSTTDCFSDPTCLDGALFLTAAGAVAFPSLDDDIVSHATPWHSWFGGDLGGLVPLVTGQAVVGGTLQMVPVIIGGNQVQIFESDCNRNTIPDECDIAAGRSLDLNRNSIPDECETFFCPADLDDDGTVGPADLAALLAAWGTDPGMPPDLDGDGDVGPADLASLLALWGPCVGG